MHSERDSDVSETYSVMKGNSLVSVRFLKFNLITEA